MRPHATRAALVLLSSLGFAAHAHAWQPLASSEPTWSGPVPYSLNEAGSEDLGGFDPTRDIVQQAFEDWTAVSCTSLQNSYEGQTDGQPFSGRPIVGWIESDWPQSPNAIGTTRSAFNSNGLENASMGLNGEHFTWSTEPGDGSRVHAYSILLHEAGHYYGLGHSRDSSATMFASYGGGTLSLNDDDREGICALYPADGGTTDDCSVTGCPDGEECVDGTCERTGDGSVCAPCSSDADCGGSGDRCIRYPDGQGYCGKQCDSDADCGGDECEQLDFGIQQCVRRDTNGDADCTIPEPTDDGTNGGEPDAGTSEPDDPDAGTSEPDDPGAGTSEPDDPDAGTGGDGDGTGTGDDPTGGGSDPMGGGDPTGGSGVVGESCSTGDDCASGLCLSQAGDTYCSDVCEGDADCPTGFECTTLSELSVCQPIGPETEPTGELGDPPDDGTLRPWAADGGRINPDAGGTGAGASSSKDVRTLHGGCAVAAAPGPADTPEEGAASANLAIVVSVVSGLGWMRRRRGARRRRGRGA